LVAALFTGCSAIESRKAERAEAYKALSSQHRVLVHQGIIDVGMDTNAVSFALGKLY